MTNETKALLAEAENHRNRMRPHFEQEFREAAACLSRGGKPDPATLHAVLDGCGKTMTDLRNAAAAQKAPKRRQDSRPVKSPIDTRQATAARLRLSEARQRLAEAEATHAELINNPPAAVPWMTSGIVAGEYRTAKINAAADVFVSKAMATAVAESVRKLGG